MIKKLSFLLLFTVICGCSSTKKIDHSHLFTKAPVVTGSLINATAFQREGSLVLGVFKPGPDAAANDETDRLSLMLIKGIKETLLQEKTAHFKILDDDQKNPDFVMDGYIEGYTKAGRFSHLLWHKNEARLSVDGEIWLQKTGEKIFMFQASEVINLNNQNSLSAAYQMGAAIAEFISKYDHPQENLNSGV
ncbi:MAG: hypothetical protein HQL14_07645 [Candidatus Omnitrophica bacterium]|nr:hypothetical protein [Candidatus Omnitrophota bacterium]